MKLLFKTKAALLILVTGLAFACKKNDTIPAGTYADSTETAVDTIAAPMDTTTVRTDSAGPVRTDSVSVPQP